MQATSAATATQSRAGPRRRRSDASPPGPCAVHCNQPRSAAVTKPPEQKIGGKNRPGLEGSPPEAGGGLTCALGSRGVRVCALGHRRGEWAGPFDRSNPMLKTNPIQVGPARCQSDRNGVPIDPIQPIKRPPSLPRLASPFPALALRPLLSPQLSPPATSACSAARPPASSVPPCRRACPPSRRASSSSHASATDSARARPRLKTQAACPPLQLRGTINGGAFVDWTRSRG